MNIIIPGVIWKSFGILFTPFQERFNATASQLTWVGNLLVGFGFILGYYVIYQTYITHAIYIIYIYIYIYLSIHIYIFIYTYIYISI